MEAGFQLVTEREAARILSVSTAALRRWRREKRGPEFVHCERCIRYDLRELNSFLGQNSSAHRKAADVTSAAQGEVRFAHASTPR
jgi:hypothetical protein